MKRDKNELGRGKHAIGADRQNDRNEAEDSQSPRQKRSGRRVAHTVRRAPGSSLDSVVPE
jgi:hypothetical protein